jgi:hypothetical protein
MRDSTAAVALGLALAVAGCGATDPAPPTSLTADPSTDGSVPPSPSADASIEASPSGSGLPALTMPGARSGPAGDYGATLLPTAIKGLHKVVDEGNNEFRQTQLVFTVLDDCFAAGDGPDPVPITVGDLDGRLVEPFSAPREALFFRRGEETTAAYALGVDGSNLCVYLSWDPTTTPEELDAARAVVESIRAEPHLPAGVRIVFTTDSGWDTG